MPRTNEPIHKMASGRYQLRYRDPTTGKTRKKNFDSHSEARVFYQSMSVAGRAGEWIPPERGAITFAKWVDEWWSTVVHLRPSTQSRYRGELDGHIIPTFGSMRLGRITPKDVRAWLAGMVADGTNAWTVRRRFAVLRKVLNDAVAMEMLAKSPCRGVQPPAEPSSDIVVLEPDEIRELADVMPEWCRSWVYVAAVLGLRWSEMLGLRRRDVDLMRRTVTVVQQSIEVQGKLLGFGPPKTAAGRRTVDVPAFMVPMLEDQLTRAQPGRDGLVFVNTVGCTPHASSFSSQSWRRARNAVGRPDLTWHHLRHTAAALAIAQGAHPKAIQERMGHSSIVVTLNVYGHLFPSLGAAVADGLDVAFTSAGASRRSPVVALEGRNLDATRTQKDAKSGSSTGDEGQPRSSEKAG